jgi:tetratricopeptide (TPR) repeat protein
LRPIQKFFLLAIILSLPCMLPIRASAELTCEALSARFSEDRTIEVCSALIRSGRYSGEDLAYYYYSRGDAYLLRGAPTQYPIGESTVIVRPADADRAMADYNKAIEASPDKSAAASSYCNRAGIFAMRGDLERAIADLNKSLAIEEDFACYHARGEVYGQKGDFDRAIADYSQALSLYRDEKSILGGKYLTARCKARGIRGRDTSDLLDALEDCNKALKAEIAWLEYPLNIRGIVHFKLGAYDKAIEDFSASIAEKTQRPRGNTFYAGSLYARGVAKMKKGDQQGGKRDIAAAKALKRDIDKEYAGYGIVLEESNKSTRSQ